MASKEISERRTFLPPPFAQTARDFATATQAAKVTAQPNALSMVQAPSAAAQPNSRAFVTDVHALNATAQEASADTLDPAGQCPVCYEKFASKSRFRIHLGKHFNVNMMSRENLSWTSYTYILCTASRLL